MNSSLPTLLVSETEEVYGKTSSPTESYSTNQFGPSTQTTQLGQTALTTIMRTYVTAFPPGNMSTMDVNTTSYNNTTIEVPVDKMGFFKEIWVWFQTQEVSTKIVLITLLGLVVLLAVGIIAYCCCRRSRCTCNRSTIRRSNGRRVYSEERHYTLPNQLQRLTKLRQDFTRRISSLWMDRDAADGESVAGSRVHHSSPRKDRNVRMPSPSPPSQDRPYMDMDNLRKSQKENETQKNKDDNDFSYIELEQKPKLDRRHLPAPPPKPHPKVRNTDGKDSLRLNDISNVLGDQQHPTYSPHLSSKFVNYQIVPPMVGPPAFTSCQQCSVGSMCHYGHGSPAMIQMPIQQPPVSQAGNLYHNRLFVPDELSSSPTTYSYGQTEISKAPWKGRLGNVFYHGTIPNISHCIPENPGYDEDSDSIHSVPNFGYPTPKNRKMNEYVLDDHDVHNEEKNQEPMYSDPTELKTEDQPTTSSSEVFPLRIPYLKPVHKISAGRVSMDLK